MTELTRAQLDQQDKVDNAVHRLLCEIAGRELDWDIELIVPVREALLDVLVNQLKMDEYQLYPWVTEDDLFSLVSLSPADQRPE